MAIIHNCVKTVSSPPDNCEPSTQNSAFIPSPLVPRTELVTYSSQDPFRGGNLWVFANGGDSVGEAGFVCSQAPSLGSGGEGGIAPGLIDPLNAYSETLFSLPSKKTKNR